MELQAEKSNVPNHQMELGSGHPDDTDHQMNLVAEETDQFLHQIELKAEDPVETNHQIELRECAICGAQARHCCGSCHLVYYCGRDHQKQHWRTHCATCRPMKVEKNDSLGRHLVASRNVRAGEVLLRESPLLTGPSMSQLPVCLGCYLPLSATCVACDRCGWPMCSTHCAESSDHRAECNITTKVRCEKVAISNLEEGHPAYRCITVLRALFLREADPARWHKLWSLESHCRLRSDFPKLHKPSESIANFIHTFFKMTTFCKEDILHVCGILQINGYEVQLKEPSYVSVYEWGSLLEHNCLANCSYTIEKTGDLVIRAAKSIACGEHLSVSYFNPLSERKIRRKYLHDTKFFWCYCLRCTDPTEMGTFFSAMRCRQQNCEGLCVANAEWLQQESADDQEEPAWLCKSCLQPLPAKQVRQELAEARSELDAVNFNDMGQCIEFLRRQRVAARLGPNHFYLTEMRLALLELLSHYPGGIAALPDGALHIKEQLSRRLLCLLRVLCPAENRIQGELLYGLHATLLMTAHRYKAAGQIDVEMEWKILQESRKMLIEAIDLLYYEPNLIFEGKILQHARKALKDLEMGISLHPLAKHQV